jgi:hypothetical protein
MQVIDYTDKSIVVQGEKTREYKENLKELGGKFNASFKCGPGWLFPKTKKASVEELISKIEKGDVNPIIGKTYQPKNQEEKKYVIPSKEKVEVKDEDAYQFILKLEAQLDSMKLEIGKWKAKLNKKEKVEVEEVEEVVYEEEIVEEEEVKHPRRLIK